MLIKNAIVVALHFSQMVLAVANVFISTAGLVMTCLCFR